MRVKLLYIARLRLRSYDLWLFQDKDMCLYTLIIQLIKIEEAKSMHVKMIGGNTIAKIHSCPLKYSYV